MKIDWDSIEDLGEISDRKLATRLGVSQSAVCTARTRRGIPPVTPTTRRGIDWDAVEDLGESSDSDIAKRLDVSVRAVRSARARRAPRASGELLIAQANGVYTPVSLEGATSATVCCRLVIAYCDGSERFIDIDKLYVAEIDASRINQAIKGQQ